jgi:hypothetical protein
MDAAGFGHHFRPIWIIRVEANTNRVQTTPKVMGATCCAIQTPTPVILIRYATKGIEGISSLHDRFLILTHLSFPV